MLSCILIAPFDEVVFAADFILSACRTQKFVFFLFHSEWRMDRTSLADHVCHPGWIIREGIKFETARRDAMRSLGGPSKILENVSCRSDERRLANRVVSVCLAWSIEQIREVKRKLSPSLSVSRYFTICKYLGEEGRFDEFMK